jgi:hypothetical protein
VKHSNRAIDTENLICSQELILNSCNEDLKMYLLSRLSLLPVEHHGGPTVFMMMVEQIVSNNEHLSRALITRLNSFTMSMVPGENVEKTCCSHQSSLQPPSYHPMLIKLCLIL